MVGHKKKFIDIEEVIKSKNPVLLKWLPGFILNYLKRIIHQDEINDFIDQHGHKKEFNFVDAIIHSFHIHVKVEGLENIPRTGGFIVASNHPLGGMDAIALLQAIGQKRQDIKFIVNDILLQLKNLEGLFIGVNKHGKNVTDNLFSIEQLYTSNQGVLIFPAGLVSRKQNGEIKDLEWKKSFITKAKRHSRNIIPVFIEGRNTNFFYNLAWIREKLGIKANLEMLYLSDELHKQKNKTISIQLGEEIPYSTFDKSKSDLEWAQWIKTQVYELRKNY